MAGIGDMLFSLMGKEDPKMALMKQVMGAGAVQPQPVAAPQPVAGGGTGTAAAGAGATTTPAAPPQPAAYTSPPQLMDLYAQLMERQRKSDLIDRGVGLLASSFAQPENKAAILQATGAGSGGSGQDDPMSFLKGVMDFQANNQALAQKAAMRAAIPAIAKENGIDVATAQYLFDTGKLDSVIQDIRKPDSQVVQQPDGTYIVVDKRTGKVGDPFGAAKPREIEVTTDDRGNKFAVYKDTGERVGSENIVNGQGASDDEKLWRADEADRKERGLPSRSLSQFLQENNRSRAGASNLGPNGIDYGNPPTDMAWKRKPDGSIEVDGNGAPVAVPVSGGKLDVATKEDEATKLKKEAQGNVATAFVDRSIDDGLNIIKASSNNWTQPITGFAGSAASYIPGSTAYNLSETLNTIKANLGFAKLQQMREASPTGGALGQVSDFENKLLQSTFGSLEQAQGNEQLVRNLYRVKALAGAIVNNGIKTPEQANELFAAADAKAAEFLNSGEESAASGTNNVDSLVEKYRSK